MSTTHIVGIDPGLVHSGVVRLVFDDTSKRVSVEHQVVSGPDAGAIRNWTVTDPKSWPTIFIEGYRPRAHMREDKDMVKAVQDLKARMPSARVIDNTGVKKVIKQPLMELLGCWKFSTPTNHQDLRSAARIALLGMVKDEALNKLLADIVLAHLEGRAWDVVV